MLSKKPGSLYIIPENLTRVDYLDILKQDILATFVILVFSPDIMLAHDNDSKHGTMVVKESVLYNIKWLNLTTSKRGFKSNRTRRKGVTQKSVTNRMDKWRCRSNEKLIESMKRGPHAILNAKRTENTNWPNCWHKFVLLVLNFKCLTFLFFLFFCLK